MLPIKLAQTALFLFFMASFLTACALFPQKNYVYTLPESKADQKCTQRCSYGKNNCQKLCRLKNPGCFLRADKKIQYQYESYRANQQAHGKKVVKTLRDFDQNNPCYYSCSCTDSYNTCYTACGGMVRAAV